MTDPINTNAIADQPMIDRRLLVDIRDLFEHSTGESRRLNRCLLSLWAYEDRNRATVGGLLAFGEREFIRMPNFGRKTMTELKETVGWLGLKFGDDIQGLQLWPKPDGRHSADIIPELPEALRQMKKVERTELQNMLAYPNADWRVPLPTPATPKRGEPGYENTFAGLAFGDWHPDENETQAMETDSKKTEQFDLKLTEAQQALLEQFKEVDDPDVDYVVFQAKETGILPLEEAGEISLQKIAIALSTLGGERPEVLFVTKTDDVGFKKIVGLISDNRERIEVLNNSRADRATTLAQNIQEQNQDCFTTGVNVADKFYLQALSYNLKQLVPQKPLKFINKGKTARVVDEPL